MTTPRDDIAGLSEGLRIYAKHAMPCFPNDLCSEAATQLDSLLKERDALQARVKDQQDGMEALAKEHLELARDYDKLQTRVKELESGIAHAQYRSDNCDAENQSLYNRLEAVESRALRAEQERDSLKVDCSAYASRNTNLINDLVLAGLARDAAEQERDEAYERAAKVADKKADDLLDAASRLQGYIGATKLAYTEADLHEQAGTAIKALVDDIRRLAGPEKENHNG